MTVNRQQWALSFLSWAGFPTRGHNLEAMIAWISAEGTMARFNPLATTKRVLGSTDFNSVGVQNYSSQEMGLNATLATLKESGHRYGAIRRRLKRNARARLTLKAVERSAWGTGGLALSILDDVRRDWSSYANVAIGQ